MGKQELDLLMEFFIPPFLELRDSSIAGKGIFATVDLPIGTRFEAHVLTSRAFHKDLRRYIWSPHRLIAGLGFYANGSCDFFMKNLGRQFGPYKAVPYNCVCDHNANEFIVVSEIHKDEEVILNYGDQYFFRRDANGQLNYGSIIS